jgi:hypothetical protein
MKTLLKTFSITLCLLFLCITCKKIEQPIDEPYRGCGCISENQYVLYTEFVESNTNSYFHTENFVYNFDFVEGHYFYPGYDSANIFFLRFEDTLRSNHVFFELFTEIIEPEIFFQNGSRIIDAMRISYDGYHCFHYKDIQSVFTWESVFYENMKFVGKGSLEITDTLFLTPIINYSPKDSYFPPQKIEFEFKN